MSELATDMRQLAEQYRSKRWLSPLQSAEANQIHGLIALQLEQFADRADAAYALGLAAGRQETEQLEQARTRHDRIPRHTIEQQEATIYFRLIEDPAGAWVTYANHNAIVTKLEKRIEALKASAPDRSEER